ncbi:potassium channel subfamily K member 1-like [Protopterus annectens]|uniref:potassium channel subfamily K member 1-like n=1 Tax=Protopterus annectens TaxID=7888 RepID=UPI001CFC1116|nr:potassium channel subfamily K member 1-like [Protopterus annectens]
MLKIPKSWNFWILMVSYIIFLIIGTAIFSAIERPFEDVLRQKMRTLKGQFLHDHDCLSDGKLEEFLEKILSAHNYGISALKNNSGEVNWDFTSALFFTSTVLTTTGYGHTVPLSDAGKIFCIVYTAIGIPLTLLILATIVQKLMDLVTVRPITCIQNRWGMEKKNLALIHAATLGFIMVCLFFLIPAAIFTVLEEDWNFLESLYFCFISLSTIGLGDYVPGTAKNISLHRLYEFGITCYLLVGLIAMLLALETVCELPELKAFRKLFYHPKDKHEEDQMPVLPNTKTFASELPAHKPPVSIHEDASMNGPYKTGPEDLHKPADKQMLIK